MASLRKIGFSWRQFIPEHEKWDDAKIAIHSIMNGKTLNYALCNLNSVPETLKANQIILKFIRGKALLPWYVNQFKLKFKPLVLIRHPFAIAASLLKHPAWSYDFKRFEIPNSPYNHFYKTHFRFLASLQTKEEHLLHYGV